MSKYLNITNGERNTKFPIYHTELWDYFKKQQQAIWTAEELDLSKDTFEVYYSFYYDIYKTHTTNMLYVNTFKNCSYSDFRWN